jgi:methionyl-tRNA synthetase
MTAPRQILVTSALPYANGQIHLGHLVEYLQTDIWVRFQKLRGHRTIYVCADDTHGTAIMNRARIEGRPEEAVIAEMRESHVRDFTDFGIAFDNYGSTHCDENRELCGQFWKALRAKGLIAERDVEQLYDPVAKAFLADRFVKGTCPKCGAEDQYGDSCEKCLATYSPTELINPRSTLSGATPEFQKSLHSFVVLEKLHTFLDQWIDNSGALQSEIANYLKNYFLKEELRDWDVSRPARYFGFEIPDRPGHYWFVWFDAPIGYIASTWQWCKRNNEKLADWWQNPATEIHHFIGKDITYFHTLFWPGMLHAAEYTLPKKVHIHGFLTVNGEKMSKSRGTFVLARTYLDQLDPAYLRYYYASKLSSRVEDLDLNLEEFEKKANSDLVGKVVNLASRTARFVNETGLSATYPDDGGLFAKGAALGDEIAAAYEECNFSHAMRLIMQLADAANAYVDAKEPWKLKKDPTRAAEVQQICSVVLNLFRQIVVYLSPVLPRLREQTDALLHTPITQWSDSQRPLTGSAVAPFQPLLSRVDPAKVQLMIDNSKDTLGGQQSQSSTPAGDPNPTKAAVDAIQKAFSEMAGPLKTLATSLASQAGDAVKKFAGDAKEFVEKMAQHAGGNPWNDGPEALAAEPLAATCTIDDFAKVDLRVARIVNAEHVPEANKLLKLTVSLGGDTQRTVFAGIKAAYKPEDLVGRLVIVVANLQPRQMKFGLSEGMVTAAGAGGTEVFLLSPDSGAKPGHRVH